jgi:sugar/nucleoside kinase (ribokinase family)
MLDVVCFGEILWDLFESRTGGQASLSREFRREFGGAEANVATALARLGVRVALVGGVGGDPFGVALVQHLVRDGVDIRYVIASPARTGLTFVVRDGPGLPRFIPYRVESADGAIGPEHITPAMGRARWVLVGTSTLVKRELADATEQLLDFAERGGAQLVVDLNVRPRLWSDRRSMARAAHLLVARAALVKASDADLHALDSGASPLRWLERHAPRASWLVTRGPGVASAIGQHGEVALSAHRVRCVDPTGAGDAFLAGSLATLLAAGAVPGAAAWREPAVWHAALRTGHILGRKAVSRRGAVEGLVRLGRALAVIESVRQEHRP